MTEKNTEHDETVPDTVVDKSWCGKYRSDDGSYSTSAIRDVVDCYVSRIQAIARLLIAGENHPEFIDAGPLGDLVFDDADALQAVFDSWNSTESVGVPKAELPAPSDEEINALLKRFGRAMAIAFPAQQAIAFMEIASGALKRDVGGLERGLLILEGSHFATGIAGPRPSPGA